MIGFDDLRLVAAVSEAGSVARAAERLRTHPATVYRRLQAIERLHGALFERQDGRRRPTDLGEAIIAAADGVETRLAALNRTLAGASVALSGTVTVTTADTLVPIVCAAMQRFKEEHAEIRLRLRVSNAPADMTRNEADVAIRPTRTPPETLVGRRAGSFDYGVYAASDSVSTDAGELAWIGYDETLAAIPAGRWLAKTVGADGFRLRVDSLVAAAEAACSGFGRALLPDYLARGRPLTRLDGPIPDLASQVWVLTHPDLRRTPRIRAFMAVAARVIAEALPGPSPR